MLNSLILAASALTAQAGYGAPAAPPPQTSVPAPVAPPKATAAVPARALKSLPNLTIHYYDVAGKNLKALRKSLELRRKDASGQVAAASSRWNVDASFSKGTVNGACKITAAHAAFTATAELPRLVNERAVKPSDLAIWRNYVAELEAAAAAKLWSVHDRIGGVEKAILASSCVRAQSVGAAAIEQLKTQVANPAAAPPGN